MPATGLYRPHEVKLGAASPSGHATLRAFVTVFRAVRVFFRTRATVVFDFGAALTEAGNSSLGCFAVR